MLYFMSYSWTIINEKKKKKIKKKWTELNRERDFLEKVTKASEFV